jgi:hypothetical protein
MDVFVALMSVHFATSDYIREVEYPIAKKRHGSGEIEIVPVFLHDPGGDECDWLMKLNYVPREKSWVEISEGFTAHNKALPLIRRGIKTAIDRVVERRNGGRA